MTRQDRSTARYENLVLAEPHGPRRRAVLGARSAPRDTANQPRALPGYQGQSLWLVLAAVLVLALSAAPGFTSSPSGSQGSPAPAPQTPATQGQQPAPKPAPPATPAPPAASAPARPFPEGAKIAYVNIQRIANESAEGKAATAKVQALNQKKVTELNEKNKALQASQQKLQSGGSVMSDQARAQLEKEIERLNVDIQRATQDAQQEVQELQQELQNEFQRKLLPVVQQVAQEKAIQILFSAGDSGIVWADTGLDITADVIKKFDTANPVATPKPDASAPAAPAPKPPAKPPGH